MFNLLKQFDIYNTENQELCISIIDFLRLPRSRQLAGSEEPTTRSGGAPNFGPQGPVYVSGGKIVLGMGDGCTGITFIRDFPTINFEVTLDAMRVEGNSFLENNCYHSQYTGKKILHGSRSLIK